MSERMTTVLDDPLVAALAKLGERYDAERAHPADSIALLAEAGLLRRFAPVESGGETFADADARHRAMFDALRRVGRGDLSVGRLFEGHINAMALFGWYATASQKDWLRRVLDHGAAFGVWATEPAPGVALIENLGGRTLQGAKSFASGAGGSPMRSSRSSPIAATADWPSSAPTIPTGPMPVAGVSGACARA
ncbi:acyl-CoA dehydrogenase family protein [Sphingomonas sp. LR59]|uniref:acyl-CoA dehydrogenase family protein n=1 Tax=Sphingomonas sp. LR59 TaxID=3050232 RepID=UPI002FDF219D